MNRMCFLKWLVLVPLIPAATAVGPEPIAAQQSPDRASRWTAEDGSAILLGASADQPADPKARERVAAEPYRGFRIVGGPRAE